LKDNTNLLHVSEGSLLVSFHSIFIVHLITSRCFHSPTSLSFMKFRTLQVLLVKGFFLQPHHSPPVIGQVTGTIWMPLYVSRIRPSGLFRSRNYESFL